jgi:hypothetical protein
MGIVTWRKARASASDNACVEVGIDASDGRMLGLIRDSKSPERGYLTTTPEHFAAFIADIREA